MGKNYLILGTESMSSTVAFLDYNPTLKLLKNNEKKYLGKKLIVSFSVKTEANGFTFQAFEGHRYCQINQMFLTKTNLSTHLYSTLFNSILIFNS